MLGTSLEWNSSFAAHGGRRLIIFRDNQAVVYSATKGRSSSNGLCHLPRQAAAHEVAAHFHVYHTWVPTLLNPADAVSRYFEEKHAGHAGKQLSAASGMYPRGQLLMGRHREGGV